MGAATGLRPDAALACAATTMAVAARGGVEAVNGPGWRNDHSHQTLTAVIAGCEAAWAFFGGVFKVLGPDNLKPVVSDADALNPRLSVGWLDYAQHAGFVTDPARVRSPKDKPRVERAVQYVRGNFWAGEDFTDLADAQARADTWCAGRAGMRIHGTI